MALGEVLAGERGTVVLEMLRLTKDEWEARAWSFEIGVQVSCQERHRELLEGKRFI
jgi:hypothetical protein